MLSAVAFATQLGASGALAPDAPTHLLAQASACTGTGGISAYWAKFSFPATTLDHYNLYRDGALLTQPNAAATTYFDVTAPGDYHSYTISAVDTANHETARSAHASAIAVDCTRTPPRIGAIRVAAFLVDNGLTTKAQAAHAVFDVASNIYRKASWGQTWLVGDVFGPYTLSPPSVPCDMGTIISDVRHAAGIAPTAYDDYMVFGAHCGSVGSPELGAVSAPQYVAHELGHELGMYHASSTHCSIAALDDRTCKSWVEYGNKLDFMGGNAELNAPHKDSLGWLNFGGISQVRSVSQAGNYDLAPLDTVPLAGDPTPRAIKIITGPSNVAPTAKPKYVYLEFRVGTRGVLATQTAPVIAGYHNAPSAGRNFLVSVKGTPFLKVGTRLQFPQDASTVTVTVTSVTHDRATVNVTIG